MRKVGLISGAIVVLLISASFRYIGSAADPSPNPATISTLELTLRVAGELTSADATDPH